MLLEKHFYEIFNSFFTPCLVLLPDSPHYTILEANKAYTKAAKTERSELIHCGLFEAFPPNPADPHAIGIPNLMSSLERVVSSKKTDDMVVQKYDIPVRGTDKFEVRYWDPINIPVVDEAGDVELILHIVRDVTDTVMRKIAEDGMNTVEKHLQETNDRLTMILESITDGFFAIDKNWIVTYWNKEAERLARLKREKILGRNLWEIYPPSVPAVRPFHNTFQKVMNERRPAVICEYYEPMDSWFEANVYPGEEGISVFFKEITQQKRAESEKEHLMHVIRESLNEIYIFDSELLRFSYVNNAALMNMGYSMEQMSTMTPLDIKPEYDMLSFQEILQPLKKRKAEKIIFETTHRRANGSFYPVEVHLQLVQNGSIPSYLAVILDITERKKSAEEREKLISELTQNNRDLRQFTYITSHNLRSPISNLTSLISLTHEMRVENRNLQEILNDVETSTQMLKNTVDDLTEVLLIKDQPSVHQEKVGFSEIFERVLLQTQYLIKEDEPLIEADFKEAPYLIFNQSYLESIFLNLLTNALKFRSPERKLEITARSKDAGDRILLEFRDNGIGLDIEKYRDRFFGLYQRFHSNSDSKGLGLYLIKSQVETLGGTIEAISRPDEGMSILIHFRKY